MTVKERIKAFIKWKKLNISAFCESIGVSNAYISSMRVSIQPDKLKSIALKYPELNIDWLLTGKGEMIIDNDNYQLSDNKPDYLKKKLIPMYDDVITKGGVDGNVIEVDSSHSPSEFIDAGDWFPEATSAVRHYGDSMVEYPSGSILVLKRVVDVRLLMWGRNYVIETSEYRITKQLQDGGNDYIIGYSTNKDTYPDGKQIHSPIYIPKDTIRHFDVVLGCVIKEYSDGGIIIR
ncbi:MAG: hypothetical protein VB066_01910 [Paludibacter sp.]|nr:hypothetical protein [Paludibacter sp.]